MSDSKKLYEVTLTNIRGEEVKDVTMCSCVKAPFYKKASFWMLKVNMSSLLAQQLMNELTTKTVKHFELKIYEVKKDPLSDEVTQLQLVHHRQYKCIHAINSSGGYKINIEDENAEVIIMLVDFIIFDLFIKRTFNRKFSNMSAFDVLVNEYENKFLKEKYGSKAFSFNHIGVDGDKNTNTHKELLISANNDLEISDHLLYNKKAMNAPSFYFFDDFYLPKQTDSSTKAPITCHFINLNKCTDFDKFDITKWHDVVNATTLVKEIPINDDFYKLIQGQDSIVIRKNTMIADINKDNTKMFYPKINTVSDSDYTVSDEERMYNIRSVDYDGLKHENSGNNTDFEKRQKHLVLYSQDTDELTKLRLKNYRLFIESRIKQFVISQTQDCFCDWMQFGRAYNLSISGEDKEHFLYTPIAIQNVFYKEANDRTSKQITRALLLEYYYTEDKTCAGCTYYNSSEKYCVLHVIAKEPESWCYDHK